VLSGVLLGRDVNTDPVTRAAQNWNICALAERYDTQASAAHTRQGASDNHLMALGLLRLRETSGVLAVISSALLNSRLPSVLHGHCNKAF
jgi:hypothetical protein